MTTNLSRRIITTTTAIITVTLVSSYAAAQPSPTSYYVENPIGITPAMIIIFASIVGTFFLMGCLSVYARSCVEYGGGDVSAATFPLPSTDGLEPAIVESFPAFVYSEVKGLKIGKGALECAVCLCEFEDTDTLRLLPKCCHVFHQDCIDTWLFANITCPVCRAVLVPLPGETNNFVLPVHEPEDDTNPYHTAEDDIVINIQSPGLAHSGQTPQQSIPPRSTSRKNRLFGKFKRSFTTGHMVVKPDVDYTRFTLRLPEEVQSKLVSRSLSQAKSSIVFSRVRSKRNGYRSASVGANMGRSLMNYERFEPEGRPDRWRFMRTLSNFSRTGLIQSPNRTGEDSEVQDMGRVSKNLSRSVKSSFQFGANDSIKEDVNVGERSFDRLI